MSVRGSSLDGRVSGRMLTFAAAALLLTSPAFAEPPHVRIPRATRPPTIEDFLDRQPDEGRIEGFVQREPGDGVPVSESTVAYLSYDDDRFYVVFVCEEREPSRLRARLAPREAIAADDQVGVLLDTFHDRRRAYLFSVNPLGIQSDALLTEGQPDDYSYDTVWYSSGRLTANGFIVWIAIPFKSLRLPPGRDQEWGLALVRAIPRNSEQAYWPAVTRRVEGLAQQFATVEGLEGISPARNLQLTPYLSGAAASIRGGTGDLGRDESTRAGADVKLVIRDALTLDVAVNPDFSQVESDQPQVTTNQRFEVFFPEKRPFFIENAGYFLYGAVPAGGNVPPVLFFSRRIVDPSLGARLTGKLRRWAMGGLVMDDRAASVEGGIRSHARIAIARVQRDLGAQSSVGFLVSRREASLRDNGVVAVDARVKLGANWVLTGLFGSSHTTSRITGQDWGTAVNLNVNRTSRRLLYNAFYSDRSPSFRADLGFVPRTDIRQIEQYIEYRWHPSRGPIVAIGPNSYFRLNWNRAGELQEWIVRYPFQVDLKGRTSIFVRRVEYGEVIRGIRFREHLQTLNVQTEWLKWLAITESIEGGRSVNYFPPPGVSSSPADFLAGSVTLSLRTSPQFRTDLTYLLNRLRTAGSAADAIFDNHLARTTLNYQFTRRLSVRAIADYRSVLSNPIRVALPRTKQIVGDVLLTYLVQPGTALYVGYTSTEDNAVFGASEPMYEGPPTRPQSRQLFVKTSYLLRF